MNVVKILGVPFATRSFDETVTFLAERIKAGVRTHVVTANPEVVMVAREDARFRQLLEQAYVVPDGIGIVYASRWLGHPISERVTGIELMEALMRLADENAWKVYLLGASPEVNEKAAQTLAERYPRARIAGRHDGYFSREEEPKIAATIAAVKPHLLFVALGAPKQDEWIARYWDEIHVPLAMGVGGSFDVIAGTVKRAPEMWQRMHLEWLYRLLRQPSRWRRQLAIPRFVLAVLRDNWGRRL